MVSQSESQNTLPWRPAYFIGGHPAFDFINTLSHRSNPALAVDRFDRLDKILGWCAFTGLLDMPDAGRLRDRLKEKETWLVGELEALRKDAGAVFDAVADGRTIPSTSLASIMTVAGATLTSMDLSSPIAGPAGARPAQAQSADALIGLIAMQLLDAFYRLPHERIRICPGCRWLFVDRSRPGRRRWCSMQDCGNRAKVRRHYHRQREEPEHLS